MGTHLTEARPQFVVNLVSETVGGSTGHGVHTAFLQTRTALERAGCEVRVNVGRGCDIVHIETMGLKSLFMLLRTRERAVVTAHIVPESLVGSFALAPLWLPIGTAYMHAFYALADEVVAVSPEVVDGLRRMRVAAPVRFVPNAIDVERFRPKPAWRREIRARHGIDEAARVVLCAGQVQPRKGIHAFVRAAHELPDTTFVWVGGMPFARITAHFREMQRIKATAPSNCLFVGDVPYDDMPKYYAAADCLFFPSRQETFGLAIIEAAAAGLPLVLRDIPTYGPLFGDAYIAADDATFAARIRELFADPDLREMWAARAREMATRFDVSVLGELLVTTYGDVLSRAEAERSRSARRIRPAIQWAFGGRAARRG